jgi:hypothetical protein
MLNTPSADSYHLIRSDLSLFSLVSKTDGRSPEVNSTAFEAQPLDLHSVPLMDRGFAAICQFARTLPHIQYRLASLLHASFRPRIAGEENNGSEASSKPFQVIQNWLRRSDLN